MKLYEFRHTENKDTENFTDLGILLSNTQRGKAHVI